MDGTPSHAADVLNETGRRGREIYERQLKPLLEASHHGQYLLLDVNTGAYEVTPTKDALTRRTQELGPSTSRYMTRIGYGGLFRWRTKGIRK